MKVIIVQSFEGYPDKPEGPGRHFEAGPDAVDVPDEFGALIVKKGHAKPADGAAPVAATPVVEAAHEAQ